ncbi:hypothetical protein CRE_28589 [Caenorhabditis remanei]|uniref:Uncharacterized protein n=1 Tax=Caenorhabditis remanei TaxID=31234 RepID=E3LN79_CAERE|nr:hypothetical protein CRE_28589 [Caenorhabditis remanei]
MIIFLFITIFCGVASGYEHRRPKKKCKKLRHFVFETDRDNQVNREPTYSYLEKDGKQYVKISCPNDGQSHALVTDNTEKDVEIYSPVYDAAVLTAGYYIHYLAKCDGDDIWAMTTDWRRIKVEMVACISYMTFDAQL